MMNQDGTGDTAQFKPCAHSEAAERMGLSNWPERQGALANL